MRNGLEQNTLEREKEGHPVSNSQQDAVQWREKQDPALRQEKPDV